VRTYQLPHPSNGATGLQVSASAYWRPRYPRQSPDGGPSEGEFRGTLDDAVVAVREALDKATSLRMLRADVPVGSYLSGGLDSSVVAALALRAKGQRFSTFSLRFDDAEYDETPFQQRMIDHLGSAHQSVVVSRRDIAEAFPEVIAHTERPILRTAPTPMFLLSRLVRRAGIKVVLTGEGADEMFAGYDIFREAKVRRFWARQPQSRFRPRLLERLYPYLARSPVSQQGMARQFFGRNLGAWQAPEFAHEPRWHTTGALKRLFSAEQRAARAGTDAAAEFLTTLPPEFAQWSFLARDQYIEVRTLLSGYLLSSQGDRMLMANSVEGRFPFLDREVVALADSLPAEYKLRVLDEKHVVKRASEGLIPKEILQRTKQPYRAPDALSFVGDGAPGWVAEALSERAVAQAGVFDPRAVTTLWNKCRARAAEGQFSNTDNMAVVGVLSTQLLHQQFIARQPDPGPPVKFDTMVEP
jgi:asparagine synthase (glutamine-hydrolysing)